MLELDPNNSDAAKELKLLNKKIKSSNDNAKKMFSNFFKDTSEKGAGYYEGVEATPDPHEGLSDQQKVDILPDSAPLVKERAQLLLDQKEKMASEQAALAAKIAEMERERAELMGLR